MYEVIEGKEEHLSIVVNLERQIFEPNLQANEEVIRERFKRYNGLVLVKRDDVYAGYTSFAPIKEEVIFNFEREFKEGILPPTAISSNSPYLDVISIGVLEEDRKNILLKRKHLGKTPSQLMMGHIMIQGLKEVRKAITIICETDYSYGMAKHLGFEKKGVVKLKNNIIAYLMLFGLSRNVELLKNIEGYYQPNI